MAVLLKFTTDRTLENPIVKATIHKEDYQESDIEVVYARLAMRYFLQITCEMDLVDNPNIEDISAVIAFSRNDLEIEEMDKNSVFDLDDFVEPDPDDYVFEPLTQANKDDNNMAIGFKLFVENIDIIGGLATPPVVLSTKIYAELKKARDLATQD